MVQKDLSGDWGARFAPTIDELKSLALNAYAHMPDEFRALSPQIRIEVSEFPDDQVMDDLDLDTPYDILCLFEGRGVGERFHLRVQEGPELLTLYRRAILDYWSENMETLGEIISHILLNEIGQNFGLSEEELERLDAEH
ncbi:metallopeptidase family protein [Pseudochrobactrum sp. MP213Fo]|uniref:metallopeptidase family protein n=1 Tax=Pseudochrobactrum sp. MP213Fo TaxID=3022250 RepID=UPI003BA16DEA